MAPTHHNMGWRKPVPKLSPDPSVNSARPSRSALRRLSLTIVNKDMPPLPTDWRESIETALKKERRYGIYVSPPPSPPPKDDTESLALTLVEQSEAQDATPSVEPPHADSPPIECVQRTQVSPVLARRVSQKSLPQIYRPPTPPLPAQHPKLRPQAAELSSESVANTLYNGLVSAERKRATPSPNCSAQKAPDASRKTDARMTGRRCAHVPTGNEVAAKPPAGSPPSAYAYRASATASTSTGNRSSARRSYAACDVCSGVWYALKGWVLHVRAKMSHAGKY
ncbi:hypothetical protein BD413DRAFT_57884 [Trametes elegans]|nr:hypothetical protein BD413DRAFT_57884 [Trametes elegans]